MADIGLFIVAYHHIITEKILSPDQRVSQMNRAGKISFESSLI